MTQYVDSSAFVRGYVDEDGTEDAVRLLLADLDWVTGNHTYVEVSRALHRSLPDNRLADALRIFEDGWARTAVVALDDALCRRAAVMATMTGTGTLDALHLAAAERAGGRSIAFVTFDLRQAMAARSLGYTVLGI